MKDKLSDIIICEKCGQQNKKGTARCSNCGNELYRDFYKGLWLKNIVITFGLFLLPFIILFYVINFEISSHFENQVKQGLIYSVDVNARAIESFLDERKTDLLSIAKMNIVNLNQIKSQTHFLKRFILEKPGFDFIAVADLKGNILFSTNNMTPNIAGRTHFKKSLDGEFYNSGIFYSDILDTAAMIISSPLYNLQDRIIGVILASVYLKTFYNLILDLRIGETSEFFLVDEAGIFLSPSRLGGKVLREYSHFKEETNPRVGASGVTRHRDYRGKKVLGAYKKYDELNWYFVSEMDVAEAFAPVTRLRNAMFYIFLIFGCFILCSSIFFARQVTYVLKNLTRNLKEAFDDIIHKKNTINTINVELRKRLRDCESLSKQLRISEEYIKNIINSISSGLIAINRNVEITYCNDFVKTFAENKEISMNDDLYKVFPVLKNKEIKKHIENIFSKKKSFRIRKVPVVMDDTNTILSIAGFPIIDRNEINGATLVINDITEQERLHAQMADYEKLSSLSQLALGAAHEINNPLLGITSYIELLLDEEEDVEKKSRAKEVLDSAYRISETVRGLLNFARPTPPKFTKISLNKLISETLSFLHHQPLFRKIEIEKTLSDAVPQITADINQIRQVLINIFINAAQAMPKGGTLTIITNKVKFEELIEIKIIDTGSGISKDDLKKVFDPFFTTKKGEGTGLGLSISYSYIKNHNGRITMTSELNSGTEVTILIPIRQVAQIQSEVIE
jgi:signal transduction histidine kinase